MSTKRESGFELLRILCICLIISFHYVYKAGFSFETVSVNKILVDVIYHFGELGVNCFILLSGYFFEVSRFKWKKVLLLSLQVLFYLLLGRGIMIATGYAEWNQWGWETYLFPILRNNYWFVTVYVFIYVLTPYIQKFVYALSRKEFRTLLIVQILIWSVYPTFVLGWMGSNDTEAMPYYNRYVWLIVVYLMGAYIKLYGLPWLNTLKKAVIFEFTVVGIIFAYILLVETQGLPVGKDPYYFWPPNSFLQLLLSLGLFGIFLHVRIGYNRCINYVASCCLGIYMLHDETLAPLWWVIVFKSSWHQESRFLLAHIFIAVVVLMGLGVVAETVRKKLEQPIKAVLDRFD